MSFAPLTLSIGRNSVSTTLELPSTNTKRNEGWNNFTRLFAAIDANNAEEVARIFIWVKGDLSKYPHPLNKVLHECLRTKPRLLKQVRNLLASELRRGKNLRFTRFTYLINLQQTYLVEHPDPKWFINPS